MSDTNDPIIVRLNELEKRIALLQQDSNNHLNGLGANLGQAITVLRNDLEQISDNQKAMIDTLIELLPGFESKYDKARTDAKTRQRDLVRGAVQSIENKLNRR